jgi:glycosyltransferase involved in cell wall biosynthesis
MKLVHIVPRIDQEAAGPSYSVPRLCQALAARNHDVELSCIAARGSIPDVRLDLHRDWPILKRFEVSSSLVLALRNKARVVDIVHNHSLWSMVNVASGLVVPGLRAKLVASPRGTLSPWALGRARTLKMILKPLQWRALERADLLHATSEQEYAEIRAQGLRAPVAVIPNGIDVPHLVSDRTGNCPRRLLFLGRIHPTKCVDRLLRAWQALQDAHCEWELVISGRGEQAYVRQMQDLCESLNLKRVSFTGPIYGDDKFGAYRRADLFVLPSHSENFGMVVAEALSVGCPVIASKGTPWHQLDRESCGWWVEHDVETLATTIKTAMQMPRAELASMGLRGRAWMQREFSWEAIGNSMEAAYQWLLDGSVGPVPKSINLR